MSDATALYDVDEIARMLGRSPKSIYRLAAAGQIPCRRLNRTIIFPRAWIDRWLAGDPIATPAAKPLPSRSRGGPRKKPAQRRRGAVASADAARHLHDPE